MTMEPVLQSVVYQQPPSPLITAIPVITLIALACLGLSEIIGKHLQYSKFWNVNSQKSSAKQIKLSSRTGMLILYAPAFLAGVASFVIFPDGGTRILLVKSALTVHFCKRVVEVLLLHKYSGGMILGSAILISLSYFIATVGIVYFQYITQAYPEPAIDLLYVGLVLFLVGICGNFYHHYLLAKLRKKNEKGYKIPKGGLFNLVLCPHYFFEILMFLGVSFISQTMFSYSCAIGVAFYLIGRSYVTRKWYVSKFENFPKEVKALIPYVF